MEIIEVKLSQIHPYKNNPRKNDSAVGAVAESISQCGYCAPIIVDEDYVILAGHTRLKALQKLNWDSAEVVVRNGLTDQQKKKYRLLDNKTGEIAEWDMELLELELADLDFESFDFGFEIYPPTGYMPDMDIDTDAIDSERSNQQCLVFGDHRVPLLDNELAALNKAFEEYINREGVAYGFGLWLAQRT